MGGMYIVSEKQASSSLRSSHRLRSNDAVDDGEWVKPTPASQMYSQLSIVDMSSGLSYASMYTDIGDINNNNNISTTRILLP